MCTFLEGLWSIRSKYRNPVRATSVLSGLFGLAILAGSPFGKADTIAGLFNTGVDGSGTALSDNVSDPHYALVSVPTGSTTAVRTKTTASGSIGGWLFTGSSSDWIGPNTDSQLNDLPGNYDYRTTFTASASGNLTLSGQWLSDNTGEIFLNGVDTGQSAPNQFSVWNPFTIDAQILSGINTLDFVVFNAGSSSNPTGLRVEFTGASLVATTPLPSSARGGLVLIGGLGLMTVLHRRKSAAT